MQYLLCEDLELAMLAVEKGGIHAYKQFPDSLRSSRELVLPWISRSGSNAHAVYEALDDAVQGDREISLKAMELAGETGADVFQIMPSTTLQIAVVEHILNDYALGGSAQTMIQQLLLALGQQMQGGSTEVIAAHSNRLLSLLYRRHDMDTLRVRLLVTTIFEELGDLARESLPDLIRIAVQFEDGLAQSGAQEILDRIFSRSPELFWDGSVHGRTAATLLGMTHVDSALSMPSESYIDDTIRKKAIELYRMLRSGKQQCPKSFFDEWGSCVEFFSSLAQTDKSLVKQGRTCAKNEGSVSNSAADCASSSLLACWSQTL